jgi:hypothetical protein
MLGRAAYFANPGNPRATTLLDLLRRAKHLKISRLLIDGCSFLL